MSRSPNEPSASASSASLDRSRRQPGRRPGRRPGRALETVLLASTACLLAAVAWPIAMEGLRGTPEAPETPSPPASPDAPPPVTKPIREAPITADSTVAEDRGPRIQLALLLDTSGSMDGLIDQARSQLWSVVNALDGATFKGEAPRLEIALYEYGNDRLAATDGWIRQVQGFTTELDVVSQALFTLSTYGGSEHAGEVIARSLDELDWNEGENVLRVLYIAGNETMQQGPVDYRVAARRARERGVVVNTVLCGSVDATESAEWREAADLGGGRFLTIDQDRVLAYVEAPQDAEIARLGQAINETYVYYGAEGRKGLRNQVAQDANAEKSGKGSAVTRSVSKSSGFYDNARWDLVDALSKGVKLAEVERATLPEDLRSLDEKALRAHLEAQTARRADIQARLAKLAREREAWLQSRREEDVRSLDTAIIASIHEQARAAGFTLSEA